MLSDLNDLPAIKLTETDSLRFEVDTRTPFGEEIAKKELRETPEIKQKAIVELRNLLQGWYITKYTLYSSKKFEFISIHIFFIIIK